MKLAATLLWFSAFLLMLFAYGCAPEPSGNQEPDLKPIIDTAASARSASTAADGQDSSLLLASYTVLKLLKAKDYHSLSGWLSHSGVRFSPYAYVDTVNDQLLSSKEIADMGKSKQLIEWGKYDGSGEPILLNISKYFDKFIYDNDFLNTENHSINKFIGQGNSLNNLKEVYPDAMFVEFYFPGTAKNNNMDWRALRLVFKKTQGRYYLIAIVHDQWTT